MKIFFGILKYSVLAIFVAIGAVTVAAYLDLPVPTKPLIVQTGSMAPSIPAGSLVVVAKKGTDGAGVNYVENDVITFQKGKELVSHRVVNVVRENGEKFFQTKGDANQEKDPELVPDKHVVGRIVFAAPFVGKFVSYVKQPLGFILLITVPTMFFIISELMVIVEEVKKRPKKRDARLNIYKPITLTVLCLIFIGSSFSYFSDVAVSSNNTFVAASDFSNLKINEFVANPGTAFTNEWVEIYNSGTTSVNLTGWTLDDPGNPPKSLTSLGTIAPGAFVVFNYGPTETILNNAGDTIDLIDPSLTIEDTHTYGSSSAGISIGRSTNGTGSFQTCATATKGTSNNGSC